MNRSVSSSRDQDALDDERHKWLEDVVGLLERSGCNPSDLARVSRLHTYTPKGLSGLIHGQEILFAPDRYVVVGRNAKHRNEMSERLDRILEVMKKIEC